MKVMDEDTCKKKISLTRVWRKKLELAYGLVTKIKDQL